MSKGHFSVKHQHRIDHQNKKSASYLTYVVWCAMINGCFYRVFSYRYGVPMDVRWLSFDNFVADMGERQSQEHQIERIDNTQGYFKNNCRWAIKNVQAANRRKTTRPTSSRYIGVSKKRGFWMSYIQVDNKMTYLGFKFATEEEAKEARNRYISENDLINLGFAIQ